MNICVQQTFRVFNFHGLTQPQKYFNKIISHEKNLDTKIFELTVSFISIMCSVHKSQKTLLNL